MTIKTKITQEDYRAFISYVVRSVSAPSNDRIVWVTIIAAIGLGLGLAIALLHLSLNPTALPALVAAALIGAFMVTTVFAAVSRRQIRRLRPSDDGLFLGAQQVTLGDDGIHQESSHHQALYRWPLVQSVGITEQHVFVMVDRIGGIILPKRAFSTDGEREQFVSEIRSRSGKVL